MAERMWLRQLAAGRDFAVANPIARTMENFVYLVGDTETRECLVVDPAWDVPGILGLIDEAGYTLTGALVSHWHPDHVGGSIMDSEVEGLAELTALRPVPVHVHAKDARIDRAALDAHGVLSYPKLWHTPKIPGLGDVRWGAFFGVLSDVGYDGPVAVEVEDRVFEGSLEKRRESLTISRRHLLQYLAG